MAGSKAGVQATEIVGNMDEDNEDEVLPIEDLMKPERENLIFGNLRGMRSKSLVVCSSKKMLPL